MIDLTLQDLLDIASEAERERIRASFGKADEAPRGPADQTEAEERDDPSSGPPERRD